MARRNTELPRGPIVDEFRSTSVIWYRSHLQTGVQYLRPLSLPRGASPTADIWLLINYCHFLRMNRIRPLQHLDVDVWTSVKKLRTADLVRITR